jgi:hypothetical protein
MRLYAGAHLVSFQEATIGKTTNCHHCSCILIAYGISVVVSILWLPCFGNELNWVMYVLLMEILLPLFLNSASQCYSVYSLDHVLVFFFGFWPKRRGCTCMPGVCLNCLVSSYCMSASTPPSYMWLLGALRLTFVLGRATRVWC